MLEEWAIVGSCKEFVAKLKERCSDIFSTVLLDLAPQLRRDEAWVARNPGGDLPETYTIYATIELEPQELRNNYAYLCA